MRHGAIRHALITLAALAALAAPVAAMPAAAQDSAAGEYTLANAFEMYVGLLLREDGTYAFALSVGGLDQKSAGTWKQDGDTITLTTDPVPVPPVFAPAGPEHTITDDPDSSSLLRVTWPNGRDIPGIYVLLGCADGSMVNGYTQYDGWSPESPCADPQWITLDETMHNIGNKWFPITGNPERLHFILVPNDFGVLDLTGSIGVLENGDLFLGVLDNEMHMVRVNRGEVRVQRAVGESSGSGGD